MLKSDGTILRYNFVQRIGHWLNALAFVILLLTGLLLFFWPLSPLAGAWSRDLHRLAAILLVLGPIFYFLADRRGFFHLLRVSFTYSRDDVRWFIKAPWYFLGIGKDLPPQGEVNAGQRVHHAFTIVFYNLVAWSGFAMWFGVDHLPSQVFLGALIVHDVSMTVLTVLMLGHVYFTFVYGALDGMIKGTITRLYAQVEHPRWLDELEEQAAAHEHKGQTVS
ncbi:MAG: cytochrome b/b6 domain-containing protein [Anaerolineales bacterium]|nr:cytochrome b/b6 domain-containing protein [Anaerolineales bacterium]